MRERSRGALLGFHASLSALVGLSGLALAYFLPREARDRLGAFYGVAAALISGAVVLPLKARALERSLGDALRVLGFAFGLRLALLLLGLVVVMRLGAGRLGYVVGFFGVYFALQWIEIAYVLAEQRRRGAGS